MVNFPHYRPKQLSLGPLEAEILNIIWDLKTVTVKDVHQRILSNPDRELAYTSVTTVLKRLTEKGWLACEKSSKVHLWTTRLSREQANAIFSYDQLQQFLEVSNPDLVAAFADDLDQTSLDKLDAIAQRLKDIRAARGN
jgi:predicted transcriptional regulator